MSLSASWEELALRPGEASDGLGVPTIPLPERAARGQLRLALGSKGERRLLIPVDSTSSVPEGLGGAHMSVRGTDLKHGPSLVRFIDVTCTDDRLEDVFSRFVDEVARRVESGRPALDAVSSTLDEYRELFATQAARDVPLEEALGLLGELLILRRLLRLDPEAVSIWVGSAGGPHDFVSGRIHIEAKASLRRDARRANISSLEQLEVPKDGYLYLAHHVVEENARGAIGIPELAREVLGLSADRAAVAERIKARGLDPDIASPWERRRFELHTMQLYHVVGDFPRITPSMLPRGVPGGVSGVAYQVDLSIAAHHVISDNEVEKVLQDTVRR